jgi:hypothetical protein
MKNIGIILLSVVLSSCSLMNRDQGERPLERNVPLKARNSNEPLKRVFVLPFLDVSAQNQGSKVQQSQMVRDSARRVFVAELLRYGSFVVIKNSDFPKDLETLKATNNTEYDLEKVSEIAQGIGVSGVMEGQIVEIKAKQVGDDVGIMRKIKAIVEAKVRVRVYGGESKKEIFNEMRSASVEATTTRFAERGYSNLDLENDPALVNEAVQRAFQGLIPSIDAAMRKIIWTGRIAMVRGEKIYINAGRASGLQVGDLLRVMDQGQDIYDPQTGTYLGRAEGRMKGTIEIVSYFGKDGAVGVVHSGADFKENDKVELY